jgi:hypothetical protein
MTILETISQAATSSFRFFTTPSPRDCNDPTKMRDIFLFATVMGLKQTYTEVCKGERKWAAVFLLLSVYSGVRCYAEMSAPSTCSLRPS